jgi:hypothetical protein
MIDRFVSGNIKAKEKHKSKKKIKVAYLVVNENLNSELLRRQVIELLGDIKCLTQEFEITLFSFQGILSIINHRKDVQAAKSALKEYGIKFVLIPNFFPWPFPIPLLVQTDVGWRPRSAWSRSAILFFQIFTFPLFFFLRFVMGYRLFHCRSYPATSIALAFKKLFPSVSVIFDPRSDYPEENVTANVWEYGSPTFRFWKEAEKNFLKLADTTACIGETYAGHYKNNLSEFNYFIAPNNVRCVAFKRNDETRRVIRRELGIDESAIVFVYLGGMTSHGWHRPDFYVKFYDNIHKNIDGVFFIFLVPKHASGLVRKAFGKRKDVAVISPSIDQVALYMSASDFGMMFFHQATIRVGTKIGEYLAASLPIIVNQNCIGAVDLISKYPEIGCIVNLALGDQDVISDLQSSDVHKMLLLLTGKNDLYDFAEEYFDNKVVANTYIEQYRIYGHGSSFGKVRD